MHFANSILEAVYIKNIKENCSIFVFINLPICCFLLVNWKTKTTSRRLDEEGPCSTFDVSKRKVGSEALN